MLKKSALVLYLLFVHALAVLFVYNYWIKPSISFEPFPTETVESPTEKTIVPTPQPIPSIDLTTPTPDISSVDANSNQTSENSQTLMIPVVGVKREQLRDTYNDARSENRVHNAIDIMAAGGTPVVAASDGEIVKFFDSVKGGITIYQFSPDKHFIYYYAHLQKRADNLKEHDFVKQGTLLGFVGDTGNAGAGNFHLHFEIMTITDPKRFFDGVDLNPYSLLKNGVEAK